MLMLQIFCSYQSCNIRAAMNLIYKNFNSYNLLLTLFNSRNSKYEQFSLIQCKTLWKLTRCFLLIVWIRWEKQCHDIIALSFIIWDLYMTATNCHSKQCFNPKTLNLHIQQHQEKNKVLNKSRTFKCILFNVNITYRTNLQKILFFLE